MSVHTPGPWTVFSYEGSGPDRYPGIDAGKSDDGGKTIVMWGDENDEECGVRGDTPEEALANAKLIAAAPALADELERATQLLAHIIEYAHYTTDYNSPGEVLERIENEAREVAKLIGYDGNTCTALRAAGRLS